MGLFATVVLPAVVRYFPWGTIRLSLGQGVLGLGACLQAVVECLLTCKEFVPGLP